MSPAEEAVALYRRAETRLRRRAAIEQAVGHPLNSREVRRLAHHAMLAAERNKAGDGPDKWERDAVPFRLYSEDRG